MSTWMDAPTLSSSSPSSMAKGFAMNATSAVIDSMVNHSSTSSTSTSPVEEGAKFNPSMAIIIVVLLGTFFFMGFLSIYVKKCVTTEGDMDHYHFPMSWASDHSPGGRWHQQHHSQNQQQHQGSQHFVQNRQPQGLDKAAIQALPIVGFTKSKECCVCLGEFQENECLRLLPRCGHTFHVECIDMWLVSHTTCPLCRFKLTADNVLSDCAALQHESAYQQESSARNVDALPPPEAASSRAGIIVLLPDYGDHQLGALQQVIEAPNFEAQPEETSISIPPDSTPSSSSSSSDQSSSHDLEQGISIQQSQQHEQQECGNEEHNLPRLLLLKVWKALRCWKTGLRTRIVGNSIFLASSTTATTTTGTTTSTSAS